MGAGAGIRFAAAAVVLALAFAGSSAAGRDKTPFARHVSVVYEAHGQERFLLHETYPDRPVGTCVPGQDADQTETFNFSYRWTRLRVAHLVGTDEDFIDSTALVYDGGPGRVSGPLVDRDCVNPDRSWNCDTELIRRARNSGGLAFKVSKRLKKIALQAVPWLPQSFGETGCYDPLQVARESSAVGEEFHSRVVVLPTRWFSHRRPGARYSVKVPLRQRPDVDCRVHQRDLVRDPCNLHLTWSGTLTFTWQR